MKELKHLGPNQTSIRGQTLPNETVVRDKLEESKHLGPSQSSTRGQSSPNETVVRDKLKESKHLDQSQSSTRGQSSANETVVRDKMEESKHLGLSQNSTRGQSSPNETVLTHKRKESKHLGPSQSSTQGQSSPNETVVRDRVEESKHLDQSQSSTRGQSSPNKTVVRDKMEESKHLDQSQSSTPGQNSPSETVLREKVIESEHLGPSQSSTQGQSSPVKTTLKDTVLESDTLSQCHSSIEGQRSTQDQVCDLHKELVQNYCETCGTEMRLVCIKCQILHTCPSPGHLKLPEKWKLKHQFSIIPMHKPQVLAVNQHGDIAVTSLTSGVKVFSKTGQMKCTFMEDCSRITGIAVSRGNKYIVSSGGENTPINFSVPFFASLFSVQRRDYRAVRFYTEDGEYLSEFFVKDAYNDTISFVNTIAIDHHDQIIAGVTSGFNSSTISIHDVNSSLKSRFATEFIPFRLAATCEGKIICCCRIENVVTIDKMAHLKVTKTVQLMDYNGKNMREIAPPPEVTTWNPGCVCCGPGYIYVVNKGIPKGVFQYTSNGDFLGCVTKDVSNNPGGITLSQDGMDLFVIEIDECTVKIFHRSIGED